MQQPAIEVVRALSRRAVPLAAYAGLAAALACDCLLVRPRRRAGRRCPMDLSIRRENGEFVLDWVAAGGEGFGVSWHPTLSEALAAAERAFGITPAEWRLPAASAVVAGRESRRTAAGQPSDSR